MSEIQGLAESFHVKPGSGADIAKMRAERESRIKSEIALNRQIKDLIGERPLESIKKNIMINVEEALRKMIENGTFKQIIRDITTSS